MRTLLAGEGDGVWLGVGTGVPDSSGAAENTGDAENTGEAASVGVAVGGGDSCARTAEAPNAIAVKIMAFAVISSGVELSLF